MGRGGYDKSCYKRVDTAWCSAAAAPCRESDHISGRKLPVATCTGGEAGCSLNGVCGLSHPRICNCDKPWTGAHCGVIGYALTPAIAKVIMAFN